MTVAVEFNGPVVAKGEATFVTNCGESGCTIYPSDGWWWVRNGKCEKWQ